MMIVLGIVAVAVAMKLWIEPARELIIKLGTMKDWARRENPELYARTLQPLSSSSGTKLSAGKRLTMTLRADLSGFGEIVQRLQREAKVLDRKAHIAMWPIGLYAVVFASWGVFWLYVVG
jgi:hypothetical protein